MQVRMELEGLTPTMQDGKEADFRTEVFGVGRDGFQSLGCGPEQNAVDSLLVLESDRGNLFRHSEDDMKVRDLKKFGLAILKPLGSGKRLTFWAMAIPARVEGVSLMTALVAALHMAAESGCPAHFNRGRPFSRLLFPGVRFRHPPHRPAATVPPPWVAIFATKLTNSR